MTKELDAKHIFQMTNIFTTYFYCGGAYFENTYSTEIRLFKIK